MKNTRLTRLQSDYEAIRRLARLHPRIEVEGVSGNPPERYRLILTVRSLREKTDGVVVAKTHRLEVVLPGTYPRDAPLCRMLTPVFHPNIAPHAVCIGDHWSAADSLDLMIQRVGEMLAFQSYNVKSPLNGRAAQWVEENLRRLPIDPEEFFVDLDTEAPEESKEGEAKCGNCGEKSGLVACPDGHLLCPNCVSACGECGRVLCLVCGELHCPDCLGRACANCGVGGVRASPCAAGHALCPDCSATCETCGRSLCIVCGEYPCADCAGT